MSLVLRELQITDEKAFNDMMDAWDNAPGFSIAFGLMDDMNFESYLKFCSSWKLEENCPEGYVPATNLYAFIGTTIVGKVNLRHRLNDYLLKMGGHIGYGVLPKFRGKGYASDMLKLTLEYCKTLHLPKVLITCDETNLASRKVIEKNGGVLENVVTGKLRYWISL